jgi:molybdate/tungstate transport system ATP-binding protein
MDGRTVIDIRGVHARLGSFELRDVTFAVPTGQYGVVIGPAGSGKTTLLETIAGIIPVREGTVTLDGRDAHALPPEARKLGFVYQHGYLFPHLSVDENIAYGAASPEVAREAAKQIGADALSGRPVRVLSGGERQLVAIARALAAKPSILLLDEPFSALDPRRRVRVRREVRALHHEWNMTVLQVTHDFTEAGLLGDVAILLDSGRVLQSGPPERVFREPASPYIAEFLGAENVLAGTVHHLRDVAPDWSPSDENVPDVSARGRHAIEFRAGPLTLYTVGDAAEGPGHAVIRAEEILLSVEPHPSSARNVFRGRIAEVASSGALTRVTLEVNGTPLIAALTTRSAEELALETGREVWASFKAMAVHLC